jgi:branched-chain amino acid transport system ATP-binding protein
VEYLLEFRDVHAHYGAFHALKGVSLRVAPGERVAVFGHNGSGKSTLLKACVGTHKTMGGRVLFAGEAIVPGAVARNVQRGIGFIPQSGNVFSELSVEQNLHIAGLKRRGADLDTVWTLFPFLRERRKQLAGTMSGGEQRLLAFGMALMTKPRLLLLDEPTTGLSPAMATLVLETARKLCAALQIALLIVEQNVPRTLSIVERALIMKSGRLVSDGPAAALVGRKDLWEWF